MEMKKSPLLALFFGYYSRFLLGFLFRRSPVIIDQASGNQREEQVK